MIEQQVNWIATVLFIILQILQSTIEHMGIIAVLSLTSINHFITQKH